MPNPTTPAEAFAARLTGAEATALVALVEDRVTPGKPTQEPTGDYLTFYRSGGGDGASLGGANGLKSHEMRVEGVAQTQATAEAILDAANELLDGWRDRDIGVQGCFAVGDRDEATQDDGRQVAGQTYSLHFKPQ